MEFPHIDDIKSSATPDEEIQKLKDSLYSIDLNIEKIETMMKKRIKEIQPKINYSDETEIRLNNITKQIYILQMRQLADNVISIRHHVNKDEYFLEFSEGEILDLTLNEREMKSLMKFRTGQDDLEAFKKEKDDEDVLQEYEDNSSMIGNFLVPSFNICHHCKLPKPDDMLYQCQMFTKNGNFPKKKVLAYSINQSYIIEKDKVYLLNNYKGDIRELLNDFFSYEKNNTYVCRRYYCSSCLSSVYGKLTNKELKYKFICPYCMNKCTCSRCIRSVQLNKLISLYIINNGDINQLYFSLINKSSILLKLKDNIVLSRFVVLNFESEKKEKVSQEQMTLMKKYKSILEEYQKCIGDCFEQYKKESRELEEEIKKEETVEATIKERPIFLNRKRKIPFEVTQVEDAETQSSSDGSNKRRKKLP